MNTNPPLLKFSKQEFFNPDELSAELLETTGESFIEPVHGSGRFHVKSNVYLLNKIALHFRSFEQGMRVRVPHSRSFVHGFPIQGTGQHVNDGLRISGSVEKGALAQPGPTIASYSPNYMHFGVSFDSDALSRSLDSLTAGAASQRPLKLDLSNHGSRPEAPALRNLVHLLMTELDREPESISALVAAEFEQAIAVAFLCGTAHSHSRFLQGEPPSVAPQKVRVVEEYIEAHWDEPISVETIAIIAGASARSIFKSFKGSRGYSPMTFVKRVRLQHARQMLESQHHASGVTEVAFACGFGNLGHFAKDYRKLFGEAPSETLTRSKWKVW